MVEREETLNVEGLLGFEEGRACCGLGFLTLSSRDPHESYRIVSSYHVGVV
jgi:hypothetical protein